MIETLPTDHAGVNTHSYCTCESRLHGNEPKRTFICNWSLSSVAASLKATATSESIADDSKLNTFLGLKDQATMPGKTVSRQIVESSISCALTLYSNLCLAVTTVFNALKTALLAGPSAEKWCDTVHPKFWDFLAMGPNGYDFNVVSADDPLDGLQLEIMEPVNTRLLNETEYATYLLQNTMSVRFLVAILKPLTQNLLTASADVNAREDETVVDLNVNEAEPAGHGNAREDETVSDVNAREREPAGPDGDVNAREDDHVHNRNVNEAGPARDGNVNEAEPVVDLNVNEAAVDRNGECVICMDARARVVIQPCNHMCLCEQCADFAAITKCPICQGDVKDSLTVFLPS